MLWVRVLGWMLAEYNPGSLRMLTQYKPGVGTSLRALMTRKIPREEYSGRQSRCFLDSMFPFCQKKKKKKQLLTWSKCSCWTKAGICSPPSKPDTVQGALLFERNEWCDCYWTASFSHRPEFHWFQDINLLVLQLIKAVRWSLQQCWGHRLWDALFVWLEAMRQLLTVCSEKSISSPANKGLQGLKTPKLSYWEYCCFLDHFYKRRDCFYFIFCLDCSLFILKCAKTTTTKEESRHEKSCGRNRYNKITELSGPGCLYNISCIRKGLKVC